MPAVSKNTALFSDSPEDSQTQFVVFTVEIYSSRLQGKISKGKTFMKKKKKNLHGVKFRRNQAQHSKSSVSVEWPRLCTVFQS